MTGLDKIPHEPLTGGDLYLKVKELRAQRVKKSEVIRSCGYVEIENDGKERLLSDEFLKAWQEARILDGLEIRE